MSKTALVLGCTGQDGSILCDILLEKGYAVHGLHRHTSTGNLSRIQHLLDNPAFTLHRGDLTDVSSLYRVITETQPALLFNEADQDNVGWSRSLPGLASRVTYAAVADLLEIVRQVVPACRVFQPCSSTMFGDAPAPQSESTPFDPQSPYAVAKCLTPRSKVLTEQGWKPISKVRVGEQVWTHKGRLRKVTEVFERDFDGDLIVLNMGNGRGTSLSNFQLTMTPEHPVLTARGWVTAGGIVPTDKVSIVATSCKQCGKQIPAFLTFCGNGCKSRYLWNNNADYRENLTQQCRERELTHRHFQTETAVRNRKRGVIRRMKQKGPNSHEVYLDALFQVCCPGFFKYVGDGGAEIAGYYPDWINENEKAIIEYFGWGQGIPCREKRIAKKVKAFEELGYRVLVLRDFQNVAKVKKEVAEFVSSLGSLEFLFAPIKKISSYRLRGSYKKVFNLEVEEDNSFVAAGIVVHNCAVYHLCRYYRRHYGMHVSCGILFNHTSVRQTEEYLLHKICAGAVRIARGKQQSLALGNLETCVDIGCAREYMEAAVAMLGRDEADDYVIGTGTAWDIRGMVEYALHRVGLAGDVERYVTADPKFWLPATAVQADPARARERLSFAPARTVADVIRDLVAHYEGRP